MSRRAAQRFDGYAAGAVTVARRLLGQLLVRMVDCERLAGVIVEVEAYLGPADRAAHTYGGRRTARNASMYLPGGHSYVYFIYGLHHCLNVVCGRGGEGVAVLVRAIEPTEGLEAMFRRRPRARSARDLCSGPAKLTAAMAIDRALDGTDLRTSGDLWIEHRQRRPLPAGRISRGRRIGVEYAGPWAEKPLRLGVRGSPYLSRPLPV